MNVADWCVRLVSPFALGFGCSWEKIREFKLGFKHPRNSEDEPSPRLTPVRRRKASFLLGPPRRAMASEGGWRGGETFIFL